MNTVLHLADGALQYYRGKQNGFWGLMGIIAAFIIAVSWDLIYPILDFIGIVSIYNRLGLIEEGAPSLTFLKVFIGTFIGTILLTIIGGVLIFSFLMLASISQTKAAKYTLLPLLIIVFSPVLLIALVFLTINSYWKASKQSPLTPEQKERAQLEYKNKELAILMYEGCEEGFTNEISQEEAKRRLHRLPTPGDTNFLIGVRNEKDFHMILPRPLDVLILCYYDKVYAERINLQKYDSKVHMKKSSVPVTRETNSLIHNFERKEWHSERLSVTNDTYNLSEFHTIIDCKNIKDLPFIFESYGRRPSYREYVDLVQRHYFEVKEKFINQLSQQSTQKEFDETVNQLKKYDVPNEDIVKYMREEHEQAESY
ncbi:sulfite exporter TauE/SafE family protein [Halobacillus litoralis]|uniref:Uncharacterized protein n=1 Tax=Halobacillus litoralis TaxID=45668 RepID=A0A410MJC1_9BACI|nr:sulfite exporter TauE/SafE family protein [Halobacillus litoralis]QAS54776.1 hypothetical protein HLI_21195 [Halobacillus litoralis]